MEERCPECGAKLIECIRTYDEETYDAVKCPNGCDIAGYYI